MLINKIFLNSKNTWINYLVTYQSKNLQVEEDPLILNLNDRYTGSMVCSKQLFREALNHPFDEPKQWEIREVNDIMNHCVTGWHYFSNPRMFPEYGRQKGWEREAPATDTSNGAEKIPEGFVEVTEQMELPF